MLCICKSEDCLWTKQDFDIKYEQTCLARCNSMIFNLKICLTFIISLIDALISNLNVTFVRLSVTQGKPN